MNSHFTHPGRERSEIVFWTVWTDTTQKCNSLEEFAVHARLLLERGVAQTIVTDLSFASLIETYFLLQTKTMQEALSGLAQGRTDLLLQEWIDEHPEQATKLWQTMCTPTMWGSV